MRRAVFIVVGILVTLAGISFTLQGLGTMGGSGGMNGNKLWAVLGPIIAIVGLVLLVTGIRNRRSTPTS
jgi:hypothetical protein